LCKQINTFYRLYLSKTIEENDINEFVQQIIPCIKQCGCICIKFCQWLTPILDSLYNEIDKEPYWLRTLERLYEDCPDHSLRYTFNQYKEDFGESLDETYDVTDVIGSGSIGQVYKVQHKLSKEYFALKIIHPTVHHDMWFFRLITHLLLMIPYTNNIIYNVLPYDIPQFLDLFEQQLDMVHEANNLSQMKYNYIDNNMIIIPNLIRCSPNIIIMSYEEGVSLDDSIISEYEKMKIIVLLYLVVRYNFEHKHFNHADLHKGNWKITKDKKLVIYDFGYCFKTKNKDIIKYLASAFIDTDNTNGSENLELLILELMNDSSKVTQDYVHEYVDKNINKDRVIAEPSIILNHVFSVAKGLNIILIPQLIQAIIVQIQNIKYITKYSINNVNEQWTDGTNIYRNDYLDYYTLCKTLDIFPELQDYFKQTLNEKQVEVNELFDMLDESKNITDKVRHLLKFD